MPRPISTAPQAVQQSLPARGLFLRLRLARGRRLPGSGFLALRCHHFPLSSLAFRPGSVALGGLWPATMSSLPPTLLAQLLAFLVGDVENDAAFPGVVELDRHLSALTLRDLLAGQIGNENALACHDHPLSVDTLT